MRTFFWLGIIGVMALGMSGTAAGSKKERYRVVFEFVNEEAEQMESVLNNIENTQKALGSETEIMVIAHGPGLALVRNTNEKGAERIKALLDKRVVFAACENTLRKKNVSQDQLLPGVTTVDSGVAEVVRRQAAGWSYVKSGH